MKKILFGIMALSMAAFGATTTNPGTVSGETETASVPVTVIAELIKAPTGLTITNDAGTVLDELVIDHGRMVIGKATDDSVAFEFFKVQRFEDKDSSIENSDLITDNQNNLHVSLTNPVTTLTNTSDKTASLTSTLSLTGGANASNLTSYNHAVATGDKVHIGRVISRITKDSLNAKTNKVGIHHNRAEADRPVLTVTLKANTTK
ncbi:hypothetical protein [Cetobacterium somerae]|uniref:WxL domain-containing protein n=1 Tax=Cetobacterium somerae ATCC BAA-474 TaxID=1319815 RepID=U7VEC9_9FUSO|nr:hypothetical protein [Cetobacterium somerae]ERT69856.1 hypothetical protein HMPREF0202_00218 [Cetobacterium somerae ATCC BAA-474]